MDAGVIHVEAIAMFSAAVACGSNGIIALPAAAASAAATASGGVHDADSDLFLLLTNIVI